MNNYHIPVLLQQCINHLQIIRNGKYADLTFGGGGHAKEILKNLESGTLFAFDQDQDAEAEAKKISNDSFIFIKSNFRYLSNYLKAYRATPLNGILMDLGVSSYQIDQKGRGFMFRDDAPLDMRMNQTATLTAKDILKTYTEKELHKILGIYGEIKNAKTLAQGIVSHRIKNEINTTADLVNILEKFAPKYHEYKYFAQVFQALRIEVNDEMKALEETLLQIPDLLCQGGRLVVLSYHSLEDRMVKNFIQTGKIFGEEDKDIYGNSLSPLKAITKKPIVADENEILLNNRARSAKLRVAQKK